MHTPSLLLADSTASTAITDGVNGFVSVKSEQEYARQILKLMENHDMLKRVGSRASVSISRSWESVMEEVVLRYKDIQSSYKIKHGIIIQ